MVEQMNCELLRLCWSKGVWLSRAPEYFSKRIYKSDYENALTAKGGKFNPLESMERINKNASEPLGFINSINALSAEHSLRFGPMQELLRKTKKSLVENAQNDVVIGFAYDSERTLQSIPVKIPPTHWKSSVNWDRNEIKSGSLQFRDIRVLHVRQFNQISGKWHKETYGQPKLVQSGRPSLKTAFERAFSELRAANQIDTKESQISHFPMFRKWFEEHPDLLPKGSNGISEQVFKKYFPSLFKAL